MTEKKPIIAEKSKTPGLTLLLLQATTLLQTIAETIDQENGEPAKNPRKSPVVEAEKIARRNSAIRIAFAKKAGKEPDPDDVALFERQPEAVAAMRAAIAAKKAAKAAESIAEMVPA